MSHPLPFETLFADYREMVFGVAFRHLDNSAEAEDVTQEVFFRLWQNYPERVGAQTVGGWLKSVARNLCFNHLGRYRARCETFTDLTRLDETRDRALENSAAPDVKDADHLAEDRWRLLSQALCHLTADQRSALMLHHVEEIPFPEIARQLGISAGKAKSDAFRARTSLRRRLQPDRESLGM